MWLKPKTKAGKRRIRLPYNFVALFQQQQQIVALKKATYKRRWKEMNLIFPSNYGTPKDPSNMRIEYNAVLERAKLPKIRFHDARYTAASIMLSRGFSVVIVSKTLGHSSVTVTLNIYAHFIPNTDEEAMRLMGDLVDPISNRKSNVSSLEDEGMEYEELELDSDEADSEESESDIEELAYLEPQTKK